MNRTTVDISRLVDDQRISWFTYQVLALTFLATISEGFDVSAAAYAAPGMLETMGVSRVALSPIFSAVPLGMLFGSLGLGYIGDRFGRKPAIIIAMLVFGGVGVLTALSTSLPTLIGLRFLVGLGAGGLLPNNIALMSEFAPKRRRGSFVVIVAMGMTLGGFSAAITSSFLRPEQWQLLFLIGGLVPLALVPVVMWLLPESIRYLARNGFHQKALHLARRMVPDRHLPDDVELVAEARKQSQKRPFSTIFAHKLAVLTPLIWVCFICIQAANIGISSWLPTMMRDSGLSVHASMVTSSMYYVGGVLGGLTVGRLLDRFGPIVLAGVFLMACPVVALIGSPGHSQFVSMLVIFSNGFFILGAQLGNNTSGVLYPSAIRALGYGTASAVGRIGAVGGPIVFGWLMTLNLPRETVLLAPVVPLVIGAVTYVAVAFVVYGRHMTGKLVEIEVPVVPHAAAGPEALVQAVSGSVTGTAR